VAVKLRSDEQLHTKDLEQYLTEPRQPRGTARITDPTDFVEYANRVTDSEHTTVWADLDTGRVTAVINDHIDAATAGWRDHTVALTLTPDADWEMWHRLNGKLVDQTAFGEFIEEVAHTVVDPDAATMLEVATTMTAKRNLDFKQGTRLDTGDVQLQYEETTTAAAGSKANIEIPSRIRVVVAPWLGVEPTELVARLRWRIEGGRLAIGYQLLRADRARQDAFDALVGEQRDQLTPPVYLGAPPSPLR
jgi:uncharacterized protein YfdQ (DUF2303 family)